MPGQRNPHERRCMSGRKPNIHKAMIAKAKVVGYQAILAEVVDLLESARRASARAVNGLLTATYWQIGRRIVDSEQAGRRKAGYGRQLIDRLSDDLTERFGRGFARRNLFQMRAFYLAYPHVPKALPNPAAGEVSGKVQTLSAQSSSVSGGAVQTPSSRRAKDALEKVQTVSAQLVGRHRA